MNAMETEVQFAHLWSTRFVGIRCDDHHLPIVVETLHRLEDVDPEVRVTVVKEKCLRLVIYTENMRPEPIRKILREVAIRTAPPEELLP